MWLMQMDMLEYFGAMNCMKAGIRRRCSDDGEPIVRQGNSSDEIWRRTRYFYQRMGPGDAWHPNGIDTSEWNPEEDRQIERTYSVKQFDGKFINRKALAHRFGLRAGPGDPIFIVSRFAHQKGLDIVADLFDLSLQFHVLSF